MLILRLLPLIISTLLFAAHIMRFHGLNWAVLPILLLLTLFVRKNWIRRMWQGLMLLAALVWIDITIDLIHFRITAEQDYLRLAVIMIAVILFTIFSGVMLENRKLKERYGAHAEA